MSLIIIKYPIGANWVQLVANYQIRVFLMRPLLRCSVRRGSHREAQANACPKHRYATHMSADVGRGRQPVLTRGSADICFRGSAQPLPTDPLNAVIPGGEVYGGDFCVSYRLHEAGRRGHRRRRSANIALGAKGNVATNGPKCDATRRMHEVNRVLTKEGGRYPTESRARLMERRPRQQSGSALGLDTRYIARVVYTHYIHLRLWTFPYFHSRPSPLVNLGIAVVELQTTGSTTTSGNLRKADQGSYRLAINLATLISAGERWSSGGLETQEGEGSGARRGDMVVKRQEARQTLDENMGSSMPGVLWKKLRIKVDGKITWGMRALASSTKANGHLTISHEPHVQLLRPPRLISSWRALIGLPTDQLGHITVMCHSHITAGYRFIASQLQYNHKNI
ncbi:hypothetical protein B0H11DRAFT_1902522 [Mycena galericulata]|nr:hypothetical protein B0H11DRAFT_1902522 [Mycena galericulata]